MDKLSAADIFFATSNDGVYLPFSILAKYARVIPTNSANCSCVRNFSFLAEMSFNL